MNVHLCASVARVDGVLDDLACSLGKSILETCFDRICILGVLEHIRLPQINLLIIFA